MKRITKKQLLAAAFAAARIFMLSHLFYFYGCMEFFA